MPIFMDRHYIEGATRHSIENAHQKDLHIQDRYGLKFVTYWFDDLRSTAFCLVEASNKEIIQKAHAEAHGNIANEIIEVDPSVVEAFLGRVTDPVPVDIGPNDPKATTPDSPFRAIMFTDLKDSTATTTRLGDAKALHLIHLHNILVRRALDQYGGHEVKHLGDGIMASFLSAASSVDCAIAIQKSFAAHNQQQPDTALHLRIGLSAGEPVEENGDLFGGAVQLAARLCAFASPEQIVAAKAVWDECRREQFSFVELGEINLKGFDNPLPAYEVYWQNR